ncbi:MAG: zinc ribbon domain-containing protein [Phycisphaerales bacterium]|nr:zinc ribbon domain-containing protein [Phycisphaerales bacterium]
MPTYEYRCGACGHEFEEFQSITAAALKKCPKCGKNKLARLISAGAGIIFKGSGFYETDYRSDSYKAAAKKDSSQGAAPAAASGNQAGGSEKSAAAPSAPGATATPAETKPATGSKSPGKTAKK